jgi:AbrB family looped-hinge helix DNA binding protein
VNLKEISHTLDDVSGMSYTGLKLVIREVKSMPSVVSVSTKGWIVIPKKIRDRYNIKPGGKVMLSEAEGSLKIIPLPKDPVQDFRGILKGTPILTELLNSRREDNDREELRIGQLRDARLLPR